MNGIVGHVKGNNYIKEMLKSINHLGSFENSYEDDFVCLGKCSSQKKTILIKDNYLILFDGIIKNASVLRDEEYILDLYKKYKESAFEKIEGSFAICIYNIKDNTIVLARDKFGIRPLFYTKNNFCFASDIKAILKNPLYDKKFNEHLLKDYFLYLTNPSNETVFKGIYKVEAGSYVIYDNCEIKTHNYYNLKFSNLVFDKDELKTKLINNIDNNFKKDITACSFLSSGIDSSLIVSINKPKDTYTVGYNEKSYSEISYAKNLCSLLKIKNNGVTITKNEYLKVHKFIEEISDEPCLDPAVVSLYCGAKKASEKYQYIYSGEGSDELFAGYNSYLDIYKYSSIKKLPRFIKKSALFFLHKMPEVKGVNFLIRKLSNPINYYTGVSRIFNLRMLDKLLNDKTPNKIIKYNNIMKTGNDDLEKMQLVDLKYWLQEEINATSKMCNINHIEVIMPYLNEELYNIAMTIPSSYKIYDNTTKSILREVARDYIPNDAYQNKKLGFPVPVRTWLHEEDYYKAIKEVFNSNNSKKFFNNKLLNKMLDMNYKNKKDYTKQIWCIYSFLVWYNINF